MATGPLMLDLEGLSLTDDEALLLKRPAVGGVILFTRNYESPQQVQALIADIRRCAPDIIIAVDQEGGRVQRFKTGMTRLPALAQLGALYQQDTQAAQRMARDWGWLMASEMLSLGIDISFAPVLDVDFGRSDIIGDRAFAKDPHVITALAEHYIAGMQEAGMAATGKHFPGHGWVEADSHVALPVDERDYATLEASDLVPFKALAGVLRGVMPAHVIYTQMDTQPAGFSPFWIQEQLRNHLGFHGVVFSDDLTMEGATIAGGFAERAAAAFAAGCDMVLVCNHRQGALEVLQWIESHQPMVRHDALSELRGRFTQEWDELQSNTRWQQLRAAMTP